MSDLLKKVSYLKGYADGLDISPKNDEGKLLLKLIGVMEEMVQELENVKTHCAELEDTVADLDDDVMELFDDYYGDDYDGIFDDSDDRMLWDDDDDEADWLDEEDDDLFEIQCPNCGEDVMIDFDMLDDGNDIVCPNCHEKIELELDFEDDKEENE